jgi:hypothetical protein
MGDADSLYLLLRPDLIGSPPAAAGGRRRNDTASCLSTRSGSRRTTVAAIVARRRSHIEGSEITLADINGSASRTRSMLALAGRRLRRVALHRTEFPSRFGDLDSMFLSRG